MKAEAVYTYQDEQGEPLFEVLRLPGKQFRQRRPDPAARGGYAWNLNGTRRVLYRLPALCAHLEANRRDPIYVVEGEKDVAAIERAGGVATCNPMGAGKWEDSYSELLQSARRVVVVADSDEAGQRHADQVAASLAKVGIAAEVVLPAEGKDAADHLAAGRTLEEFIPAAVTNAAALPGPGPEGEPVDDGSPFVGLSHAEVLALELPAERYLVHDLVPCGAVGTIAGVPETHKSFLAQAIAVRVARGEGEILGCPVARPGRVGYFWQDDSTREEAERVKLYERVHATPNPAALPLRWFLNEGLELPAGLARLRATVEALQLDLVILDSFYNILPGVDLKDDEAERIVALLKREVADPTGCTVLVVDHMPWATETNRQRLRAYGGVFKNAATRFGVYLDAQGTKLWIEARGNNITGFKRTPAYWDEDALELHLLDAEQVADEEYEQRILDYLKAHPWAPTDELMECVEGRATELRKARQRLQEAGRVTSAPSGQVGHPGKATRWNLSNEATLDPVPLPGTGTDGVGPAAVTSEEPRPTRPAPPVGGRGDRVPGTGLPDTDPDEVERLAELAREATEGPPA